MPNIPEEIVTNARHNTAMYECFLVIILYSHMLTESKQWKKKKTSCKIDHV